MTFSLYLLAHVGYFVALFGICYGLNWLGDRFRW
jgi:hypothetical protein